MIDTQLVDRFVALSDPAAFRDLVVRHGPSVRRTCRALLHDPHAAEDAFQATFLVLVRKAPSIRDPERLGRWLIGVARKVAARSRRQAARQLERDKRWAETHSEGSEPERPLFELQRVVREELDRLPDQYRLPLTLCYFEGLTHEQAADRLGWPVGTVKVRLVRARGRLRDRLDRRGFALGIGFLLLLLRRDAAAAVIQSSTDSAVEAMTFLESEQFANLEAIYPRAAALSRPVSSGIPFRWSVKVLWVGLILLLFSAAAVAMTWQVRISREAAVAASIRLAKALEVGCR